MYFIHNFQCFKEFMHKTRLFFKTAFFLEFWSIEVVFPTFEIVIKNLSEPLSVSIDWT